MDHNKRAASDLLEENLPPHWCLVSRGKIESALDLPSPFADPFGFHRGKHSGAAHEAHLVAQAASSSNSANSYNGEDVQRFCHEWNVAIDRYSEATR